ncbi:putative sorting and assembly machinery (Sam50) protein [Fasciola hepatica]|uniref:Sorting and assembly machinery (Sam50) protein n=1 Tax=Fasciola hepatica TaxID=6192 RepID=A0A4E0R8L8_FASHE|nr:putative sorting and assembly machinery (Sam50) protein [Fasciola hepatica]
MGSDATFETFSHIEKLPASVDKIVVSGLGRTEDDLIKRQFVNLAKSKNLNELFDNVKEAKDRLDNLGIFRYVYAVVDVADDRSMSDKYKVTFRVAEKRFTTARVSVTHGTDGASKICGNVRLNNVLRRAESIDLDMEVGTNQLTSKCAAVSKPLENNPLVRFTVGDLTTPWNVRKESGSALKVSLRHVFERDSRSDRVFPDSGVLFRVSNELASINPGSPTGYCPNASDRAAPPSSNAAEDRALQLKIDGMAHKPFRIFDWLVAELTFSSGLTHSFTHHPVHIADRFFLGGPLELRGFEWRSVCPVEPLLQPTCLRLPVTDPTSGDTNSAATDTDARTTCPVGAEGFWMSGLHVYTPLPYFGAEPGSTLDAPITRVYNCFQQSNTGPPRCLVDELLGKPRAVIGTGVVVRFAGILRIELNYCVPVHSQPGDTLKSGFSFGFGLTYS